MHFTPTSHRRYLRRLFFSSAFSALVLVGSTAHAAKPNKAEMKELRRELGPDAVEGKVGKREERMADSAVGKPAAGDAEARMLTKLREQLDVTDDEEWTLIAERITKVNELRRNVGGAAGPKGAPLGDRKKSSARADGSMQTEQAALRAAVRDKLPDAEVKARLARVHELHQQNEAKFAQAQAELRSVLTVRQEAVAVMAGLLTP